MKVKVFSGGAGYGPDGVMTSWAPNSVVDVADNDKKAVAFYGRWIDAGTAELVETGTEPQQQEPDREVDGLAVLRGEYEELTGQVPDGRWGGDRLRKEIDSALE